MTPVSIHGEDTGPARKRGAPARPQKGTPGSEDRLTVVYAQHPYPYPPHPLPGTGANPSSRCGKLTPGHTKLP